MRRLAILLLLVEACRHLGWPLFPPELQALVWNLLGAISISVMLLVIWQQNRGRYIAGVVLWALYEEGLVATCSAWRMAEDWIIPIGEGQCTAKLGPKLVSVSLLALGVLIERLSHAER